MLNSQKEIKDPTVIRHSMYLLFLIIETIVICLSIFISILFTYYDDNLGSNKDIREFSSGWVNSQGKEVNLKDVDSSITLYHELPASIEDETLYMGVSTGNVMVTVDERLLYFTNNVKPRIFGRTPGFAHVFVTINPELAGKTICVSITNPYSDHTTKISDVYYGDGIQIVKKQMSKRFMGFVMSVVIIVTGFLCIVVYHFVKNKSKNAKQWRYMGFFAMNSGLFLAFDSKLPALLYRAEAVFHLNAEFWHMLIVFPIMLFFSKQYQQRKNIVPTIICAASLLNVIVSLILKGFLYVDLHQSVIGNHIIFAATICCFVYGVISDGIKNPGKNVFINAGFIIMGFCVIVDIIFYYRNTYLQTAMFTRIGIFLFIICTAIQLLDDYTEEYSNDIKAKMLNQLAYHDGLTGLYNRTQFLEDMAIYDEPNYDKLILAVIDINRLKHVNDTHGMIEGDKLINAVAQLINDAFLDYGKCYRIGGDEFVVAITGDHYQEKFEQGLLDFYSKIAIKNKDKDKLYDISVAVGSASKSDITEPTKFVYEAADSAMLNNKRALKKAHFDKI